MNHGEFQMTLHGAKRFRWVRKCEKDSQLLWGDVSRKQSGNTVCNHNQCDDLTNTDHREALRHRFYPFAPEVSPHELEQMLLLYAFQADSPDQWGETFLLVNDADEVHIIHIL